MSAGDPYAVLGVPRGASDKEIKDAYRRRAHETHPDREEGSTERFHPVQRAYAILRSPERRAGYDRTGEDPGERPDPRAEAARRLAGMFLQAVETLDPDRSDVIAVLHEALDDMGRAFADELTKVRARIRKLESARKRLRIAKGKQNVFDDALAAQLRACEEGLRRGEEEGECLKLMRALLGDYGWDLPNLYGDLSELDELLIVSNRKRK